ncbi:MAG: hypothetical protein Q8N23_10855 [Archangium sp.]|nr:hypothetical protein [Archangium sp.]MDP3153162.1 hypothetical protein [Archangium sp.]MDP3572036.1 hypothetical protein [Archangium sp.]
MFNPAHTSRASVSALLLVVQVLGLGHLALSEHSLGEGGEVVDAVALHADAHSEDTAHLCGTGDATLPDDAETCAVFATWRSSSVVDRPSSFTLPAGSPRLEVSSFSVDAVQFDALSRAPKASPPRG